MFIVFLKDCNIKINNCIYLDKLFLGEINDFIFIKKKNLIKYFLVKKKIFFFLLNF